MRFVRAFAIAGVFIGHAAYGYSVLSHEALVDSAWDRQIKPLLLKRFPNTTPDDVLKARAYAYGGCIIQDMGYYPFGNKLFSDLVHYVRPGDFIVELISDAQDINDYAFALGALAHYAADVNGHRIATNRAVAILYPKMRAKYGDEVTYEDFPAGHIQTEFAFDVLQVSQGLYAPDAFHSFVGFEVAKPLLERAFQATYGIEMKSLFKSEDLAMGTYRHTVASLIPKMTKVALATREKQMEKASPNFSKRTFLYRYSKRNYEKEFGANYYHPGFFDRLLAWFLTVVPKVGPFRALAFRPPTPEIDRMFLDSFQKALSNYNTLLSELQGNHLTLANVNLDTGLPVRAGAYHLADRAYERLAQRLVDSKEVPPSALADVQAYFRNYQPKNTSKDDVADWQKTEEALAKLSATGETRSRSVTR
jgi:hypothetical protein